MEVHLVTVEVSVVRSRDTETQSSSFTLSLFILLETASLSRADTGVCAHALGACNHQRDIKVKFNTKVNSASYHTSLLGGWQTAYVSTCMLVSWCCVRVIVCAKYYAIIQSFLPEILQ